MFGHSAISVDKLNGLWRRNPDDSCPKDHFTDCNNIAFTQQGIKVRPGLDTYFPLQNIKRIYTYVKTTSESLLVLDTANNIYDTGSPTPANPILTVSNMTDFGFISLNGRAYISPSDGNNGLSGQNVKVYKGDGTAARDAAGSTGTATITAAASATAGNVEKGDHLYTIAWETDTGFIAPFDQTHIAKVTSDGTKKVDVSWTGSPTAQYTFWWILATRAIQNYNNDVLGYEFFFVPGTRTAIGTLTQTINFYDADLLSSGDYLLNLYTAIPAGVALNIYHNRLVSVSESANPGLVRLSYVGQPEAVDKVTGLITPPLDSRPITYAQEYRDVLYVHKRDKTYGYPDNTQEPVNWPLQKVDNGIGTFTHGVAVVLDNAGPNIDFLMQMTLGGIYVFNGSYVNPELSFKIKDLWLELDALNNGNKWQICVDSIRKLIYVSLLNSTLLVGDYNLGLDPMLIKWSKYTFNIETDTIALVSAEILVIGSQNAVAP